MSDEILQPLLEDGVNLTGNLLQGTKFNDRLYGLESNDKLYGLDGRDLLQGGDGDDELNGGNGDDHLHGGDGDDKLDGGNDDDRVLGGLGNDVLWGGFGHDFLHGGMGNDELRGHSGNDDLSGGGGKDSLYGGIGHDKLKGGYGFDQLRGGHGNDYLNGGHGNDNLSGGSGNDVLEGGPGVDYLVLGQGYDTVILTPGQGFDRVHDFKSGEDKIQLNDGLTFDDVKLLRQSHNGGIHTIIRIDKPDHPNHGQRLAKLKNVNPEALSRDDFIDLNVQSLDGSGNNIANPTWGKAGEIYLRKEPNANYANANGDMVAGPEPRYVSNRVFNDLHVNLFSENRLKMRISRSLTLVTLT